MENANYLGIDVSKGYADFTILNQQKKIVEDDFQLDDTFEGHQKLFEYLNKYFTKHKGVKLYAAVESTGGYENNWYKKLLEYQSQMNLSVARINPIGVYHSSKAALKRVTTDKESAKNIAEYLINYPEKVDYQNEDPFLTAKRQWTFITMMKKQKTQLLNQLESMLYIANPEIVSYCKSGVSLWTLRLLEKYPTAKNIAKASVRTVSKIPYISKKRAEELISNAKHSVASASDNVSKEIIVSLSKQIFTLQKNINKHLRLLEKNINLPKEVALLKTFPGIGVYSAVGLMLEIGSIERYNSAKNLVSYFGIHPIYKQSGDGKSGMKMSKKGRKQPRYILFNVARYGIGHNEFIKEIYANHLKKGMKKMAAIGAIMHKILRIVYGMLKNNKPFDAQIDRDNRKNDQELQSGTESQKTNKIRRLQSHDIKAPISRRQMKKRKEQEQTQNELSFDTGSSSHSFDKVVMKI